MGKLPADRLRPGVVFENVGMVYAGPVLVKSGRIRRLVVTKAYIAIFEFSSVKAMHIEPVTDLSTEGFIAALHTPIHSMPWKADCHMERSRH